MLEIVETIAACKVYVTLLLQQASQRRCLVKEENKKCAACLLSVYLASEYKTAASGQTIKQCPTEETVAVNYIGKVKLMHRAFFPHQLYNIITIHETATFALQCGDLFISKNAC